MSNKVNFGKQGRVKSNKEKAFNIINNIFLVCLGLICFIPFWYEVCVSFSSNAAVLGNRVFLWPVEFSLECYSYVMNRAPFWASIGVTFLRVLLVVPISLFFMITAAYPLSKDSSKFHFRGVYVWFFFLTMLFQGGMIPSYLLIVSLGLLDSIWALVLPTAVNVFNMLLLLSFFRNVPTALEEAARVDGASHWKTLLSIYIPISKPVIATVTLFTLVQHWNSWFDGLIYMKSANYPLQTYLRTVIFKFSFENLSLEEQKRLASMSQDGIKAAQMALGALPILMVYPFLQKYFVSGITLGSVKE